jgi:transcriptional regulator with XRE-family HTH domain
MSAYQLRAFRDRHNLSQDQLGAIVGRSRSTVAAWENGTTAADTAATRLLNTLNNLGDAALIRGLASGAREIDRSGVDALRSFFETPESEFGRKPVFGQANPDALLYVEDRHAKHTARVADLVTLARADGVNWSALNEPMNADLLSLGGALVGRGTLGAARQPLGLDTSLARFGAVYVPTPRDPDSLADTRVPVFVEAPPVTWTNDVQWTGDAAPVMAQAAVTWHTARCHVRISHRLLSLSGGYAQQAVTAAIVTALFRAMDDAALVADSPLVPGGIATAPEVPRIQIGASINRLEWLAAVTAIEKNGARPTAVIVNPDTKAELCTIEFDDRALWRTEAGQDFCGGHPATVSNALPVGVAVLGDFRTLTIRHAETVELRMVQDAAGATTVHAFLDVAIDFPQPKAFLVLEGV